MILGVIGCGAVGGRVIEAALAMSEVKSIHIYDVDQERAGRFTGESVVFCTPREMGEKCHVVVEAASPEAVRMYVPDILSHGRDVIIMSVGALLDADLMTDLMEVARKSGGRIHIPSGAICGIDGMLAMAEGHIYKAVLTTVKHPSAIGASHDFIQEKGFDPSTIKERKLIFEGPPDDAVRYFPRNVNVAAALTLALGGKIRPLVRIYVDPEEKHNVHEISVEGDCGRITMIMENTVSEENPRTSMLAAFSAVATVKKIASELKVGT